MKIAIVQNNTKDSLEVTRRLKELLTDEEIDIVTHKPDIVISVGGDGTLLSAFHRYAHLLDAVRFIGVHTGHLGFYTDWRQYNLTELVDSLINDNGEFIQYPLLDVEVVYKNGYKNKHFLALNESIVKNHRRHSGLRRLHRRSSILNGSGDDGVCISTPTGSTGYNKSIGGAVLHPRLEALQLTEIASLNNRIYRTLSSPLIIAPDEWIEIRPIDTNAVYAND
ncbi:MAG: NAD kinase [Alkalibacterium sp.]|nr:NAD kinase [Alkalibacterium sp.]